MTARQRLLVTIVFVVAVIGGALLAFSVLGGGGSPEPSSVASASATPTAAAATVTATPGAPTLAATPAPTPEPTPEPTPGPTPSAAPSPTPKPTNAPGPAATIVLTQLKLDARDDPEGRDRVVTFTSGGTGAIMVALSTLSPQGSTRMCLSADGKALGCRTATAGKLTAKTTKKAASFELTLRGTGIETPVVEVTITFPATTPSVRVDNARFDGTSFPDTNGIQAIVQPRADGKVRITADWGGHPFLYEVDLLEVGGSGSQTLANQGPATRMDAQLPVTAPNPWKVLLQNIETGFGTTPMTVTIAWP
jgi:hypothetical protein